MNEEKMKKVTRERYGTFHYPHGWLGFNYDFSGICPTIDSGIWEHHTLLIEVGYDGNKVDNVGQCQ